MIENDSKYPAHRTPPRFPLVIARASVTAPIKMTPTSRVKMAFELAWDQVPQCGKKAKKRGQINKISAREASRAVAWGGGKGAALSSPQTTCRLPSPPFFFFAHSDFFSFFLQMRSLVRGYL